MNIPFVSVVRTCEDVLKPLYKALDQLEQVQQNCTDALSLADARVREAQAQKDAASKERSRAERLSQKLKALLED